MGSDLRTSARDLLSLAHKVNVLLQRRNDTLHGDIDSDDTLAEIETVTRLRHRVWETSRALQSALDHVEDIEDEDEPRILREAMDALQLPVREALQVASDSDSKGLSSGHSSPPVSTMPKQYHLPGAFATAPAALMAPGTPPSVHRHPLGLFSTSPKFTAQSPFASPARPSSASRLSSTVAPLSPSPTSSISSPSPASPSSPSNRPNHGGITAAIIASNFTPVTDGPLSFAVAPVPVSAPLNSHPHSATASSLISSTTSYSTPITSPLDRPLSPIRNQPPIPSKPAARTKEPPTPKKTAPTVVTQPSQPRRVPRGLFSAPSAPSGLDPLSSKGPLGVDPPIPQSANDDRPQLEPIQAAFKTHPTVSPAQISVATSKSHDGTIGSSSTHPPTRPETPLQSPLMATSPTTPMTPFTSKPTSPHPLQRFQPKPSPIQTSPQLGSSSRPRTVYEDDDRFSQLARDLESAMNPTPTDAGPQPYYFLQGKGLLERIPSQVSMDDGLLDDHQDFAGRFSEDSDRNDDDIHNGVQGLNRGSGSLRRQRSGGKRRFRISRSRSRNRSKGRLEGSKPVMPIEVGYPSVLTSSDWPFDKSPPSQAPLVPLSGRASGSGRRTPRSPPMTPGLELQAGTSASSAARLLSQINGQQQYHHQQQVQKHQYHVQKLQQQQYQQNHSRQLSTASMQSSKFRAGPHLPFADSVTIGNPIRVGRGIGSFTIYSITLTLCDPAVALTALETLRANRRAGNFSMESSAVGTEWAEGHLSVAAGSVSGQTSSLSSSSLSTSPHSSGGLAPLKTRASMAAQMMTRSLSFPELGHSAERLLMDIQHMEDVHRASGATSHKQYHSEGSIQQQQQQQQQHAQAKISTAPPRVIQVRKRYSDFVTLRAHLVETFKDKRRLSIFAGLSKKSRNLSSAAPPPHRVHAHNSQPITSDEDDDDEGGDSEEDEEANEDYLDIRSSPSHSRRRSNNSMSNDSSSDQWIATDSIIRGLPKLPPKRVVGKFRPAFVEKRRRELEYFLEWVVAHPVIGDCPVVVQWFLGESQ